MNKIATILPLLLAISEAANWSGPSVSYGGKTLTVSDVDMNWQDTGKNQSETFLSQTIQFSDSQVIDVGEEAHVWTCVRYPIGLGLECTVLEFSLSDECDTYNESLCGEFRKVSMHTYTNTGVTEYPPQGIAVAKWFEEEQGMKGLVMDVGMTRNKIYYDNTEAGGFKMTRTPSVGMFFEDGGAELSAARVYEFNSPRMGGGASQIEGQMGILYKAQDGTVTTAKMWLSEGIVSTTSTDTESVKTSARKYLNPIPMTGISILSYWISQIFSDN